MFQNITDFRGKRVTSIESAHIDVSALPDDPNYVDPHAKRNADAAASGAGPDGTLTDAQVTGLCSWLKEVALAGRISEVKVSDRLVDTPVLIADYEGAQMKVSVRHRMCACVCCVCAFACVCDYGR